MKVLKMFYCFLYFNFFWFGGFCQSLIILDSITRDPVYYAGIYFDAVDEVYISNEKGQVFTGGVPSGDYTITIHHLNFKTHKNKHTIVNNTSDTIYMVPRTVLLNEVNLFAPEVEPITQIALEQLKGILENGFASLSQIKQQIKKDRDSLVYEAKGYWLGGDLCEGLQSDVMNTYPMGFLTTQQSIENDTAWINLSVPSLRGLKLYEGFFSDNLFYGFYLFSNYLCTTVYKDYDIIEDTDLGFKLSQSKPGERIDSVQIFINAYDTLIYKIKLQIDTDHIFTVYLSEFPSLKPYTVNYEWEKEDVELTVNLKVEKIVLDNFVSSLQNHNDSELNSIYVNINSLTVFPSNCTLTKNESYKQVIWYEGNIKDFIRSQNKREIQTMNWLQNRNKWVENIIKQLRNVDPHY
jgi:hypothetical protein